MPKSKIHLLGRITLYLRVASRFAKNHKITKQALDTGAAHCIFMAVFGWLLLFQPIPRMVLPPRVLTLSRVVSSRPTRVPAASANSSSPSSPPIPQSGIKACSAASTGLQPRGLYLPHSVVHPATAPQYLSLGKRSPRPHMIRPSPTKTT